MSFESTEEDSNRTIPEKKKSPVGNMEKMSWDKEGLQREVEEYESGTLINWSELARKYHIRNSSGDLAKNGGQIAQEWLKSNGVDLTKFKKRSNDSDTPRVRTKLRRGAGGEITIPTPETNESVRKKLKEKVLSGDYQIGKMIAPKEVNMV